MPAIVIVPSSIVPSKGLISIFRPIGKVAKKPGGTEESLGTPCGIRESTLHTHAAKEAQVLLL